VRAEPGPDGRRAGGASGAEQRPASGPATLVEAASEERGAACPAAPPARLPLSQQDGPAKRAVREAAFGQLLRSKGFVWVAGPSRRDHCAEWSQAGNVLRFGTGGPWYCVQPREAWPQEADKVSRTGVDKKISFMLFIIYM
jgi:hypothetical protein